ncbi:MAG: RloB family protein [Clostridiales Family XIII bacterium]|nr:RloB family protein [Clostridiales Family XIII bacterium]
MLVICGGQTEQIYFDLFKQVFRPSPGNISVITAVEAKSPMQVVEYAIRARQRKEDYNAIRCVFDKDDFTDFDNAIAYAGRHKIGAAFSNQAFEVWFINHFRLLESSLHRNKYKMFPICALITRHQARERARRAEVAREVRPTHSTEETRESGWREGGGAVWIGRTKEPYKRES